MQSADNRKPSMKPLESHYRPLGLKAVLAAALMIKAGKARKLAGAKA